MVTIDGGGGQSVITPVYGNGCVCITAILDEGENPPVGTPVGSIFLIETT